MLFRALAVIAIALAGLAVLAAPIHRTSAVTPPTCPDNETSVIYTATQWLDAPGTLIGTAKRDVLVGSTGSDVIKGGAGNDIICSSPFEGPVGANDELVDGGTGNDSINGNGHLIGGAGDDVVFAQPAPGSVVDGGSGADDVSGFNAAVLLGGSGNDFVYNDGGTPRIDCGSGFDQVSVGGATDVRRCEGTISP